MTRPALTHSPDNGRDTRGGRVERDVIAVLLGMMALAALWWAATWWRAAHAEAVPAPRPPAVETALPPAPARFDRRQTLALLAARLRTPSADAGPEQPEAARALPARTASPYGLERGHGSESWSRSDGRHDRDFEPRYSPDAAAFDEPPSLAVDAPRAFHRRH